MSRVRFIHLYVCLTCVCWRGDAGICHTQTKHELALVVDVVGDRGVPTRRPGEADSVSTVLCSGGEREFYISLRALEEVRFV